MTAPDFKDVTTYLQGLEDRISALESAPLASAGITSPALGTTYISEDPEAPVSPNGAPGSTTPVPGATSTIPPVVAFSEEEATAIQSAEDEFEEKVETIYGSGDTVLGHPVTAAPYIDPASDAYVPEDDPRNVASVPTEETPGAFGNPADVSTDPLESVTPPGVTTEATSEDLPKDEDVTTDTAVTGPPAEEAPDGFIGDGAGGQHTPPPGFGSMP